MTQIAGGTVEREITPIMRVQGEVTLVLVIMMADGTSSFQTSIISYNHIFILLDV